MEIQQITNNAVIINNKSSILFLALMHVGIIVLIPPFAAMLLGVVDGSGLVLNFARDVEVVLYTVCMIYVIFWLHIIILVSTISYLAWLVSRLTIGVQAYLSIFPIGLIFGWLFCAIFVTPNENNAFSFHAKLVTSFASAVSAIVLCFAWRKAIKST